MARMDGLNERWGVGLESDIGMIIDIDTNKDGTIS